MIRIRIQRATLGFQIAGLLLAACTAPKTPDAEHGPNPAGPAGAGVVLDEDWTGRQVFPPDNWWNLNVASAPVDPQSQDFIDWISGRTAANPTATRQMHPDFGPPPYGIPYVGVEGSQPRVPVTFVLYGSQSDAGAPGQAPGYPIPTEARTLPNYIEGGVAGGGPSGDRHLLLLDRDHNWLFETWATRWNATLQRWEGAVFDLTTNARRPEGWTSADAAGLAILPGLVRYDEVASAAEIRHALRFTTRATNGYVWPASHEAGNDPLAPPMGARLRLKPDVVLTGFPAGMQKIFRAMQTYGLILADNGTDMYVSGTMDARWDNDILNPAFHALHADDFEVIQLGWNPSPTDVP